MRRKALGIVVALVAVFGLWQTGHGAWIHAKAGLAQHLLQRAWARTQNGERDVRPWPWADTWPVARLHAPGHGIDLIVLADVSGRTLAFGPGHAPGSALPGTAGTAVITGHRDTHFGFLERLRPGDELVVEIPGRMPARFVVDETAVLDARRAVIRTAEDSAGLVLLTCYPFGALRAGGPLRWAVVARAAAD
jgi:sortase A